MSWDYTPLDSPEPMSWPPRGCCWCPAPEMDWAYPIGDVVHWRTVQPGQPQQEIKHTAQPWYACARCKSYIDRGDMDGLADEVKRPRGYWDRLMRARLNSNGYPWRPRKRR